jgi:hypothetical protein
MRFLQYEFNADAGDVIVVELDHAANVRLLDGPNFSRYRRGQSHRCVGGYAQRSPVRLPVPHSGHWYVTIDLGGYAGHVRASASLVSS